MQILTTNKELKNNSTDFFKDAISVEIEMIDGKKSLVTTIFNSSEVYFEELVQGLISSLSNCDNIKSMKPTSGIIREGNFNGLFFYKKIEFNREKFMKNPIIKKYYNL
jgi:hypothetical protein